MRVTTRTTLLAATIAVVVIAALLTIVTIDARRQLLDGTRREIEQVARATVHDIERWEEIIVTTSRAVTGIPGVRRMEPEMHADAIAGAFPSIDRYAYTMYTIDADGIQFVLSDGSRGSGDRSDRTYFREAIAGEPVARQVLMGRSLDPPAPAVAYGLPIFAPDSTTETVGILLVASTLAEISTIVAQNAPENATLFVVDEADRLIAHTDPTIVSGDDLVDMSEHPAVVAFRSEDDRAFYRYEEQDTTIVSYPITARNGWSVIIEIDERVVTATAGEITRIGALFGGIGVAILVVILAFTMRYVLRPLSYLGDRLSQFAAGGGDLTDRLVIRRNDEIGHASSQFNAFVETLSTLIRETKRDVTQIDAQSTVVATTANETAAAADEISATVSSMRSEVTRLNQDAAESKNAVDEIASDSEDLSHRVSDQASAVEQSSAAIEEMVASIRSVATTARAKAEGLHELKQVTDRGRSELEATTTKVKELSGSLESLVQATSVIDGIASQTNLLSMNAAIEAAHAGESGRGFAVVAEEIRILAESAAQNAKTIGDSLGKNADDIRSLDTFAENVAVQYAEIERQIEIAANAFNEITAAMEELSTGADEITHAVVDLRESTGAVEGGANRIRERTDTIRERSEVVSSVSTHAMQGMEEIDAGTSEISSSMHELTNAVTNLSRSISRVEEALASFTTE